MRYLIPLLLCAVAIAWPGVPPAMAMTPEEMARYFCRDVKKPFFVSSGTVQGSALMVNARPGSMPAAFKLPKPPGTLRVFVVGESAAGLLGSGDPAPLRGMLEKMLPGRAVEVINCGMGAYESRRVQAVFEEALAYAPDLLVVLSGNNETGREFCPDFASELARRNRNLRSRAARLAMPEEDAAVSAGLALHEERLRSMARQARKKNVPVVFCTLPANLRDYAPDGALPLGQPDFVRGADLLEKKDPAAALERFKANLALHPREPFTLFYSGRALEALGRAPEALASYYAAVKYDPAADRCSEDRNAMIRRVAEEEGAAAADLERAFSGLANGGITGGAQLADGVHWFREYTPFVSGMIAAAARALLPGAGPAPRREADAGDVELGQVLSYAAAGAADGKFCDSPANERTVTLLGSLYSRDPAGLEAALASESRLREVVEDSVWHPGFKKELPSWRPALLYNAAEMLRRRGSHAKAARLIDEALKLETVVAGMPLEAACPALNFMKGRLLAASGNAPGARAEWAKASRSPRIRKMLEDLNAPLGLGLSFPPSDQARLKELDRPVSAQAAASKQLSDAAVEELRKGAYARALKLLRGAVEKDGDNFEARMSLCFIAGRNKNAALGEEHCGEAVYLAEFPPKHSILPKDVRSSALYSRGLFYLKMDNRAEGCQDILRALVLAPAQWGALAQAKEQVRKNCSSAR